MSYKIFTDSSCDYSAAELEKLGVGLISYLVNTGRDAYKYYLDGREIDAVKFYAEIDGAPNMPKTSMPNVVTFTDAFRPVLAGGEDVLCLTLTQKFSNSFSSANIAAAELKKEFPERGIFIADTKSCTTIQALVLREVLKMRDLGYDVAEILKKLSVIAEHQKAYVTVDTLNFLQKGGRIGKVGAFAGTLLNIKPIIAFDDGELFPIEKARGRQKALSRIVELLDKDVAAEKEKYNFAVLHSRSREEADRTAEALRGKGYELEFEPAEVGPTIGAHIGPTVVGTVYVLKHEHA